MSDQALIVRSVLDGITSIEQPLTPEEDSTLSAVVQETWQNITEYEELGFLAKSRLIWSLYSTFLSDGKRRLWQVTSLRRDEDGFPLSIPYRWADYGLQHLGMKPSTVSNYKRIWDVYVVRGGRTFPELLLAGLSKLIAACSLVADFYPARHEGLEHALFGAPNVCAHCKRTALFINGQPPLVCPHCGRDWKSLPPATLAELLLLIKEIKEERDEDDDGVGHVQVDYEAANGQVRELACWVTGKGETYPLPVREIPILGVDEIADVGLPEKQAAQYIEYMRKRMK
jgi:hypothetical protein